MHYSRICFVDHDSQDGVTGAGKTYTMSGPKEAQALAGVSSVGNLPTSNRRKEVSLNDDDGVIARAIYDLFRVKQEYVNTGNKVNIRLSCLEIYQDELRDLLVDSDNLDQVSSGPAAPVSPLKLRDIGDAEGVVVRGLETISVHSIQQVKTLMNRALLRRTTAATSMNERSSRSHAVCTLTVTITPPSSGTTNATAKRNRKGSSTTVTAKLTLVDLAGSERIKQTGVVGVHKQESININKDLFVLGKVVSALAEKAKAGSKVVHVPYRDSKLTRLLRDSLGGTFVVIGVLIFIFAARIILSHLMILLCYSIIQTTGNCSTVLIACVSPADNNVDDSVNTLRYAERSRTITNSLRQNVVRADRTMSPAECASIRAENQKLKAQVTLLQRRVMQMQRKMEPGAPKDGCSGMDSELSSLQAKLKLAEEEARAARANSRRVVETADRWREQCEVVKSQGEIDPQSTPRTRRIDSVVSPCLSYELSVGVSDVDSLIEDDDRSVLSLDTTTKEILSEDNAAQSKVEIEALKREKVLLRESLQEISDQIESKRAELKKVDLEFRERHAMFRDEVEREEKKRDELAEEVARMKIRLNLLASDVKEDGPGRNTFSSVIRGFIGEGAAEKEEVEMKIMKVSHPPPKKNDEADNQGMRLAQELAKTLGETKSRCDELETKCSTFGKELEKAKSKNKSLRDRNGSMQKEILRLHEELARAQRDSIKEDRVDRTLTILKESSQVNLENERADDTSEAAVEKGKPSGFAKSEGNVQSHVQELLRMASQAASKSDASLHSNCTTSITTDATSLLAEEAGFELETPTASDLPKSEEQFFISNIAEAGKCVCESSLLAQNSEHVEFYLPQIEYSCSCGKRSNVQEYESGDLYSLELILRPWQVEFLASIGITGAVDFVHAVKQRGGTIAQQMRRWRRQMGMLSVKTRSCLVALHIWQRTCKAVVRNVREQEARGVNRITKPHFLEVSRSSDNDTVSTLGYNSVCMNEPTQE